MRILLIEDFDTSAQRLLEALNKAWGPKNVVADWCDNVLAARNALETTSYDLICMDLDLSGAPGPVDVKAEDMEGLQLLGELAGMPMNQNAGVLIITGYAHRPVVSTVLHVLKRKDILDKPHDQLDFLAKARSILETRDAFVITPDTMRSGIDRYGCLELDRRRGIYLWRGTEFSLTTAQYRILDLLASRHPRPVPAADFIRLEISKNRESLSVQVANVREQLRSIGVQGEIIRFEPKGYVIELPSD